jgi:capsular exopolysaccharide synthesis family protein
MSRIEAALKRATGDRLERGVALEEPVRPIEDRQGLALYPEEHGRTASEPRSVSASLQSWPRGDLGRKEQGALTAALDGKLILTQAPPVAVEQYRRLAAAVHELQATHGTKTLMVTSALPQEGKTLTVTNLALTLSESYGRRVLLIDADLRRPSVHEVFRLSNAIGLIDGLRAEAGELSLIPVTRLLSVLPAGRPDGNQMAALTSDRMRVILEEAASVFDWVLLDAPPVGIMPDANLLARFTEGVIFVIAAGSTPFEFVDRALADIGRDRVVGTVLNRIDPESIPATGYYQHYYGAASG